MSCWAHGEQTTVPRSIVIMFFSGCRYCCLLIQKGNLYISLLICRKCKLLENKLSRASISRREPSDELLRNGKKKCIFEF
jgi:hypothetical protein